MNKIMLIGNLGKDPDMSYTTNGTAVTKFSLAVNRITKSASGERQTRRIGLISLPGISLLKYVANTCKKAIRSSLRDA